MGPRDPEPPAQKGPEAPDGFGSLQARRALTPEGLPRSWRLTRAPDLTAVIRHGRRHRTPKLDISWRGNEIGHPRLGVVVPRHGRTAVARNRLRRRVREIARRQVLADIGAIDLVIKARSAAYTSSFGDLAAELTSWARSRSA